MKISITNLREWNPPDEFMDLGEIRQVFGSLPKRFTSRISSVGESKLVMVEIRDNWVDNIPLNMMIIYAHSTYEKCFQKRLLMPTRNYYPLQLRARVENKFELVEVKSTGEESMGIILDISTLN